MKLEDTIEMMKSSDRKKQFMAEYCQALIRKNKLKQALRDMKEDDSVAGRNCLKKICEIQLKAMSDYIAALGARSVVEGIGIDTADLISQCHE